MRETLQEPMFMLLLAAGTLYLVLAEGDRIAADAMLLGGDDVQVDEALLTGEAVPVLKLADPDAQGEPQACLYSGTLLVGGHGSARVTATGARSEIGRIAAIEMLGATSVLCADKTGTLTENRMTVTQLYVPDAATTLSVDYASTTELPEAFHTLVEYSILASMADPFDPMEKAFHRLGQHFLADTEHLHRDWTLRQEYGLTPQLRAMSHVWQAMESDGQGHVVAAKGAPEDIIDLCHLDAAAQALVEAAVDAMATNGLRVLGVAQARFVGDAWPALEHDFEFEFVGLLGLSDPLRAEIVDAVAECRSAGIRVVMITGDYPVTARAFAFSTLVVGNVALIFSNRTGSASLWASLRVPNRTLWTVTGVTLGLLALTLYLPWLSKLFFFEPLSASDLLTAAALGLLSALWFEAIKLRTVIASSFFSSLRAKRGNP